MLLLAVLLSLSGCITTVGGAAVDVTTAVVKLPFQVGGAVVDAVSSDDEEEAEPEEQAQVTE
ncbi:MAG: hypothetical protein CO187_03920 [Zetaproteobacteria bacterium CG_4_9_14_3_um_filter_53_7]|nr:MAG: hypothetical protein CO187_03920 [Zetaproteobacteria bacterium CG_4_9_14_3_um_filter_53_7]